MIELKNFSKTLKKQLVLDKVNLKLEEGKCYGFVGYNGCGKTMLLRAVCGYIKADQGDALVDGVSMNKRYIEDAGIIIGEPQFLGNYSGMANLEMIASIRNKIDKDTINFWLDMVGLKDAAEKKYKRYSLGMKQKLRIAQAFMENPKYLILDEPFNALDKASVANVEAIIEEEKEKGKTILLTSHDDRNIAKLCDVVYEMEEGKICYE